MARITFFEKPGCANNTRQKAWLVEAGHEVEPISLLTHKFSRQELLSFFGERPVAEWINRAAPRVKSGEIVPEQLSAEQALDLMLTDPLFIRRPLLMVEGKREVGFEVAKIHAWVGLSESVLIAHGVQDVESCRKTSAPECPPPPLTRDSQR